MHFIPIRVSSIISDRASRKLIVSGAVSYGSDRIKYWLDPWADASGKGFQTIQSLLAIGSGGFLGRGIGQSRQKYLWVPEPHNDFIFSIVCEELGLIGAMVIIILFCALVFLVLIIFCGKDFIFNDDWQYFIRPFKRQTNQNVYSARVIESSNFTGRDFSIHRMFTTMSTASFSTSSIPL